MDWFEAITGFRETHYAQTRARLKLRGGVLLSEVGDASHAVGDFSLPSLTDLRKEGDTPNRGAPLRVSNIAGDARALHAAPENAGALFQVASQFNMLEMIGPDVTPEEGVTRYAYDRTQGPACAMAAGAATIYRNYLVPVGSDTGQTAGNQLNGFADLADVLAAQLERSASNLFPMHNGYLLPDGKALADVSKLLLSETQAGREALAGHLRIGVQRGAQVTDAQNCFVSQAFCSAVPVAYSRQGAADWDLLANLVLDAAYEATLWAGLAAADAGGSNRILLTRLGGGAFGNRDAWIDSAMRRALSIFSQSGLDVVIVSYGSVPAAMHALAAEFSA